MKRFLRDERGLSAVEYGLIVAVLSLAIMVGVGNVGNALKWQFSDTNSRLNQAIK